MTFISLLINLIVFILGVFAQVLIKFLILLVTDQLRIINDNYLINLSFCLDYSPKPHLFTPSPLKSATSPDGSDNEADDEKSAKGPYNSEDEADDEHTVNKYVALKEAAEDVREIGQKADRGEELNEEEKNKWEDAKQDIDGEIDDRLGDKPSEEAVYKQVNECRYFIAEMEEFMNRRRNGEDSSHPFDGDELLLPIINFPIISIVIYLRKIAMLYPLYTFKYFYFERKMVKYILFIFHTLIKSINTFYGILVMYPLFLFYLYNYIL